MRVLVVEDSERLRRSVCTALRAGGYAVDGASGGEEGAWMLGGDSAPYDVVVLDIMLPGLDGLSILGRLRSRGDATHVLLLTARDTVEDRVKGLRAGADDYLVKPFAMEELLARVGALTRRAYGQKSPVLRVGHVEIDTLARSVRVGDEPVTLAPREYALLEYLARRRGQLVTRTEIEAHIYEHDAEPMSNVVDRAVCALRRKIDRDGEPSMIHTRRGMGYVLEGADPPCFPSDGD